MTIAVEWAQGGSVDESSSHGPSEIAIVLEGESVASDTTGLSALSDRWIPVGSWRCYATAPMGADAGRIVRSEHEINLRFDHFLSPSIRVHDTEDGRVRLEMETFWPEGNQTITGELRRTEDALCFADADSDRVADLRKSKDGRLRLTVRQGDRCDEYSLMF